MRSTPQPGEAGGTSANAPVCRRSGGPPARSGKLKRLSIRVGLRRGVAGQRLSVRLGTLTEREARRLSDLAGPWRAATIGGSMAGYRVARLDEIEEFTDAGC